MCWGWGRTAIRTSCWGRESRPTLIRDRCYPPARGSAWSAALPLPPTFTRMRTCKWFSAFHPLRDRQGRVVAVLGADQRASDLQAEARERLKSILLSGFAAAALAVLLSFFLARSVTRPLKLMAESTAEIAAGNLSICLNIHSRDEVGELAASFNQMVNRLSVAAG